jgi:hypothetical protein
MAVSGAISYGVATGVLIVWFIAVLISAAYVAYDSFTKNPELTVMKWGWVLVTLYIGPIGAAIYVLSCKEPRPGTHERFVAPLWKQSLGSTIHCVAGDATGIVVASVITTAAGLAMWGDTIVEYAVGFGFGLLVFQALFMKDMLGGSYVKAVKSTVLPEWLSMNCVMAGMVVVMVILRTHVDGATDVSNLRFWGVLSVAVFVGLVAAYPVNVWLVNNGLKHGMGTVRALGEGGEPLEQAVATRAPAAVPAGMTGESGGNGMSGGDGMSGGEAMSGQGDMGGHGGMEMKMTSDVTRAQINAVTVLTIVTLAFGVLIAGIGGNFAM